MGKRSGESSENKRLRQRKFLPLPLSVIIAVKGVFNMGSKDNNFLILRGARENNLKNLNLDLPHGKLIAVTGLSGSGKSSLAFDTIFVEGQRRFIDSLSTYARQFLERMKRPDFDRMDNVQPTIALEQRNPIKTSRSTVGTVTEIYDYLRLLYAKIGKTFCPDCDTEVKRDTVKDAVDIILKGFLTQEIYITFPKEYSKNRSGFLRLLGSAGLGRALIGGRERDIVNDPPEEFPPIVEIIVDKLIPSPDDRVRLSEAIENCYNFSGGEAHLFVAVENKKTKFNQHFCCTGCGRKFLDPTPFLFSFNSPFGACPECKGFGNILRLDELLVVPNQELSLQEGAIEPFTKPSLRRYGVKLLEFAKRERIPLSVSYKELSVKQRHLIWHGAGKDKGIIGYFNRLERKKYKIQVRVLLSRYKSPFVCESCRGGRLKKEANWVKIARLSIPEIVKKDVDELIRFLESLDIRKQEREIAKDILKEVLSRLNFLKDVGLSYLTIDRASKTLSGGEAQRIMLASQLGSRLFRTTYVLDEPSIGLHPRDNDRLLKILQRLRDLRNSVIVVEHDAAFITGAEYVVELGPESGARGGEVLFAGEISKFLKTDTQTAKYIRGDLKVERISERRLVTRGKPTKFLSIIGARANNLKNININIPLERLVCITGVSGSGKSTLITETIYPALSRLYHGGTKPIGPFEDLKGFSNLTGVVLLDQDPIGKSPRSNPVTFIKAFDQIRILFSELPESRAKGLTPGSFSFNVAGGRCDVCEGEGYVKVEMYFMADLYLLCDECKGRRYKKEILDVTFKGKSIADILEMTFAESIGFFQHQKSITDPFQMMCDVGLGYLRLGQPANTLSGGEAQRLKIARELLSTSKKKQLYLLDEPTTGLHPHDVSVLLGVLEGLVDNGHSVVVIEHNVDLIKSADWVIDLGPEGGDNGGRVIAEGAPEAISGVKNSYTGRYIARAT